jgi:DNA-binding response OmpR family regulator
VRRGFIVRSPLSEPELLLDLDQPRLRLVVLDEDLPNASASKLCTRIRLRRPRVPITVLCSGADPAGPSTVLRAGADAVLPAADPTRAVLRAEAWAELARGTHASRLQVGSLVVDRARPSILLAERRVRLSHEQVQILWWLCFHADTLVTLDELSQELRGVTPNATLRRAMAQQMYRLRRRLGAFAQQIEVLRGGGFVLHRA